MDKPSQVVIVSGIPFCVVEKEMCMGALQWLCEYTSSLPTTPRPNHRAKRLQQLLEVNGFCIQMAIDKGKNNNTELLDIVLRSFISVHKPLMSALEYIERLVVS
jgi:hypothetical protein